ncbi:MAG: beta-propeller fold lactonase family protein [Gemmatales bacterium]|nr:beta-propeller fold lactonase family protein [Gemmatales bacterium]MDW8386979.1 beta-propeller fold lactonase family protein [Gemmatales bacterium]
MRRLAPLMAAIVGIWLAWQMTPSPRADERPVATPSTRESKDRSPVDVVLSADERWLFTANQGTGTVSVVETATGKIVAEVPCGEKPSALALSPDDRLLLVSNTWSGDVAAFRFDVTDGSLHLHRKVRLGFEPRGVVISPDGREAYVALTTAGTVGVLSLPDLTVQAQIEAGRWPRYLALSPDGKRLAVGCSGDGGVAVLDVVNRRKLFLEDFLGLNLGQMQVSRDGQYVYFPWMIYRQNPITPRNIQIGWVLASRIARVRLDDKARREAIALDPQGQAVSDPHGLALSPDEKWLVCAASGTHELLVFRLEGLPFQDYGGPGDHIDVLLLQDRERFFRIPLGGRPMFVRFSRDGRHVYVANYFENAIQIVDLHERKVARSIPLGSASEISLARKGEMIFYDGRRSLDQWYSCHSCHYEGHTNSVTMDTRNDGRFGNFKVVLSLRNVTRTGPWTWHGWQKDLRAAMRKSLTETMLGPSPTEADVDAVIAFLETLTPPPNPYRLPDGSLTEEAKRGEALFHGEKANCVRCHKPPLFTDDKVHDVGLGVPGDAYRGFNPPSLLGVYDRIHYLHDGRAASLEEVLRKHHTPESLNGQELTPQELSDLLAYLRSL